jgi:CheY-like chemotaxis protein
MAPKRVLSIGQCATDHYAISSALEGHFPVEVIAATGEAEAMELLRDGSFELVLINRILDADGSSGLEVIQRLRELANAPPVMLVSNFHASQRQAEATGAVPGFGKGNLHEAATIELLGKYLSSDTSGEEAK